MREKYEIHNEIPQLSHPQENSQKKSAKTCYCRNKNSCPLRGKCLVYAVVYKATVLSDDDGSKKSFIGLAGGDFKSKYNNHNRSFRHQNHENETALSKYV